MSKFKKALAIVTVSLFAFVAVADAQMFSWGRSLSQGSTGTDVMSLQKFLNLCADTQVSAYGAGSPGMESSTFGPATKAAVIKFQMKHGIVPAAGYFGPISQAKAAQLQASGNVCGGVTNPGTTLPPGCTSTTGYSVTTGQSCSTGGTSTVPGCLPGYVFSPTTGQSCTGSPTTPNNPTGPLTGGFGTISAITQLSQYNNEEVGAGSDAVKVMGFEIEASDEGDIQIQALKLVFDSNGNTTGDSDRIEDYLTNVSVWMDSTKVADSDVEDFTKVSTGVYSKNVVLSNAIVRSGQKAKFYVAVDAVSNLDSGDIDSDSWSIGLENVRVIDGSGVTTTDADSAPSGIEYNGAGEGVAISFVTFSSASDTELKIATNNTPDAATVEVDTSENTDNVVLLKGKFTVEGDSDVWLDELPVTFTATGESVVATTGSVNLTIGSETFTETVPTASPASSSTITFDDLDLTLEAGETVSFTVSADINDLEDTSLAVSDFDAGDTLLASITTTNRGNMVVENEQGDSLTDGTERTGSAIGNAMTFRASGVNVAMGTPTYQRTEDTNGLVTSVTYTIPVSVTSFGDTLYIGQSAQLATAATASNAFALVLETAAAPTTESVSGTTSITLSSSDATVESNGFRLDEGETKHFTITAQLLAATDNTQIRFRLDTVRTFAEAALNTGTNSDLLPTTNYRTGFQFINN